MGLPVRTQAMWWGAALVACLGLLWLLGPALTPFIAGTAVAYLLNPSADRLERLGLPRAASVALVMLGAVLVFVAVALLIAPLVMSQISALIAAAPGLSERGLAFISERLPGALEPDSTLRRSIDDLFEALRSNAGQLARGLAGSLMGVVNAVIFLVIMPVVTFYLLLDWNPMLARFDRLLPRDHAPVIRDLARQIDRALAGFVRGQLTVCVALGSFYAVLLGVVGLEYGVAVGAIAGLVSFIPYVGTLVGGVLAIGLALVQFWDSPLWIAVVVAIFASGQFLESNILTPKLVGRSVGLHPVWLLLALSAFGALFGFAGMLVAVPVAAMMGVLIRFGVSRYEGSPLYRGLSPDAPEAETAPDGGPARPEPARGREGEP